MYLGKCQDRRGGQFLRSKSNSNYLNVKHKVSKKDNFKSCQPVQNFTKRKSDFKQIMRLKNQLVIAGENFGGKLNLSSIQIPAMSEDLDEELILAQRFLKLWIC